MAQWDRNTLLWIERGPMSVQAAILLESPGNFSYMVPVTVVATVLAMRARRPILAISVVASYVLVRPLFHAGWALWHRRRPDLILGGVAAPPLDSFPSGHVIPATALYGLLAYTWASRSGSHLERIMIAALLVVWVGVIGLARVRLGTHWPSDAVAGAVIGTAWLASSSPFARGNAERAATTSDDPQSTPRQVHRYVHCETKKAGLRPPEPSPSEGKRIVEVKRGLPRPAFRDKMAALCVGHVRGRTPLLGNSFHTSLAFSGRDDRTRESERRHRAQDLRGRRCSG